MMLDLRIACWNTEWHAAHSPRGSKLKAALLTADPHVFCLPEARHDFLAGDFHGIHSDPDYGYPVKTDRSKVSLWSRAQWRDVDRLGSPDLPPGRFVSGTTDTAVGPIRVVGLCIPWRSAHVSSGARNRKPWEDHERYLEGIGPVIAREAAHGPLLVVGDLNQRIPARSVPQRLAEMLERALAGLDVWTAGVIDGLDTQLLCHIAGSRQLKALTPPEGISRKIGGLEVSDHDGVTVQFSMTG